MSQFHPIKLPGGQKPVLLVVLAHPDDETFGTGGTLAMYARRGVDVHLICATRGEAGEADQQYLEGYATVAERRMDELRCAAGLLGLKSVIFLDYRDSGMQGSPDNSHPRALAAAPQDQVASQIVEHIRRLRPQVVITFDPIGGYRHPDHIAIHLATVQAFELAGKPEYSDPAGQPPQKPEKLYFHTMPHGFLRLMVKLMPLIGRDPHKFGKNGDIDLASIAEVNFPTHARVNYRPVAQIRDDASACHASQGGGRMRGGIFGPLQRLVASNDTYMRAFPPYQPGEPVERDLFQGIG